MNTRELYLFAVSAVLVSLTGCSTYRLAGGHEPIDCSKIPNMQFRLQNYQGLSDTWSGDLTKKWAIAKYSGPSVTKADVEQVLFSTYPDLFSSSDAAVPLDVTVKLRDSERSNFGNALLCYLTLLGTPKGWEFNEVCELHVDIQGLDDEACGPETVRLKSACVGGGWMSVSTDSLPDFSECNGLEFSGNFPATVTGYDEICEEEKELFASEVASGIVLALMHRDSNELKRMSILRNVSGQ